MFDNTNPYTLRTEIAEGITRYFISFTDGEDIRREAEVSRPVYLEFLSFIKIERNLRRSDERHIEQSELTDETLHSRSANPPKSVEETIFDSQRNERMRQAVAELPEIRRRRFVLYHEFGLARRVTISRSIIAVSRVMAAGDKPELRLDSRLALEKMLPVVVDAVHCERKIRHIRLSKLPFLSYKPQRILELQIEIYLIGCEFARFGQVIVAHTPKDEQQRPQ